MTENELRLKSALAAAVWLGTVEGSADHEALLAIYNGIRPLPRGYRMGSSDPWCAAFVSAAAVDAGMADLYPLECSCSRIVAGAKEMGIWAEDDSLVPQIADWVLYNWDAAGSGDDTGEPDHVGIVIAVEEDSIAVAEGNYDNSVKLRRIGVNDRRIRGFVCPHFAEEGEERMNHYRTVQEVPEYARETIRRLVGDGSLRGISGDDLGLTDDLIRVLVILDRRGKL